MTTTTTTTTTATKLTAIIGELATEFVERDEALQMLMVALLARSHAFVLGPPGTGKSAMVRALTGRIVGARYWHVLMDRQLPREESFGPIDIARFEATGEWVRRTGDTLVDADVAFVDEIGKAGPASVNPYLTVMEERRFNAGDGWRDLPLLSMISASNELLETELAAIWDRFTIRLMVDYVKEPGSFARLLTRAAATATTTPTTVTLDELRTAADALVPAVRIPDAIISTLWTLRTGLARKGIVPSDRRWAMCVRVLQAQAFLSGRDTVTAADLSVLIHVLWDDPAHLPAVRELVNAHGDPQLRVVAEVSDALDTLYAQLSEQDGLSREKRSAWAGDAQAQLRKFTEALAKVDTATRAGSRYAAARELLTVVQTHVLVISLGMNEQAARKTAETMVAS
jgi:MoxR-like ATPase